MDGTAAGTETARELSSHGSASPDDRGTTINETNERSGSDYASKRRTDDDDDHGKYTQRLPKRRKNSSLKWHLNSEYRDLLNDTIREVNGTSCKENYESLPSSLIDGSYWTASEKDSFFLQISLTGPGDLPKLVSAIGSKSEPEIKAYVFLLEQGVFEADAEARLGDRFSRAEIPAANEIGQQCETFTDRAAEALGKFVDREEATREEARYGDWWLIDESAAEELDELLEEGTGKEVVRNVEDDVKTGETVEVNAAPASILGEPIAHLQSSIPVPSASLLNPTAFLQLSRSIFMNSSTNPDANWHNLLDPKDAQDEPAVYRTAFDDFYNLTLSLTRRLIQASIFQSMSRLRASSDSRVVPSINSADVNAAMNILGMECDKMGYWAQAARRCGVQVYSEKKKYLDGRPTGKNGVKLTFKEVEAELGLGQSSEQYDEQSVTEAEIHDLEIDDDAYTEFGSERDLQEDLPVNPEGDIPLDENLPPGPPVRGRSTKRKRALSPHSYDIAEDACLEEIDQLVSVEEENRLRAILDLDQLPSPQTDEPLMAFRRAGQDDKPLAWRDNVDYYAPWETYGIVESEKFEAMEVAGARTWKRRELLRHAVKHRMKSGASREGSTGEGTDPDDRSETEAEKQAWPEAGSASGSEVQPKLESEEDTSAVSD